MTLLMAGEVLCPKCGTVSPTETRVCPKCGATLAGTGEVTSKSRALSTRVPGAKPAARKPLATDALAEAAEPPRKAPRAPAGPVEMPLLSVPDIKLVFAKKLLNKLNSDEGISLALSIRHKKRKDDIDKNSKVPK